jgi:hypothetical protein
MHFALLILGRVKKEKKKQIGDQAECRKGQLKHVGFYALCTKDFRCREIEDGLNRGGVKDAGQESEY